MKKWWTFFKWFNIIGTICAISFWSFYFGQKKVEQTHIVPAYKTKDGYWPKGHWDKPCWMNALRKLAELHKDRDVSKCDFIFGLVGSNLQGHAWIEYIKKENGRPVKYFYDPTSNVSITQEEFNNYGYVNHK